MTIHLLITSHRQIFKIPNQLCVSPRCQYVDRITFLLEVVAHGTGWNLGRRAKELQNMGTALQSRHGPHTECGTWMGRRDTHSLKFMARQRGPARVRGGETGSKLELAAGPQQSSSSSHFILGKKWVSTEISAWVWAVTCACDHTSFQLSYERQDWVWDRMTSEALWKAEGSDSESTQ